MRVELEQRTDQWTRWRQGKISASMVSAICGDNPWCSPRELWQRELGITPPVEINEHMQRGIDQEDEAREWAEKELVRLFPATCFQHDDYPWAAASLDGFNEDLNAVMEIKCPNTLDECIPKHYRAQIQWQMFCSGADVCYYVSWCKREGRIFIEQRDEAYIADLFIKAKEFKRMLDSLEEPPLLDREKKALERKENMQDVSSDWEITRLLDEYEIASRQAQYYADLKDEIKTRVVEAVGGKESQCGKKKIIKVFTQGRVDYDKIPVLKGIDLDSFRKSGSVSWRICI